MYSIAIMPVTIDTSNVVSNPNIHVASVNINRTITENLYCAKFVSDIPFISCLLENKWYDGINNLNSSGIRLMKLEDIKISTLDCEIEDVYKSGICDLVIFSRTDYRVIFKGGRIFITKDSIVREITHDITDILVCLLDHLPRVLKFKLDNSISSKYNKSTITYNGKSLIFSYHKYIYDVKVRDYNYIDFPDLYDKLSDKLSVLCDIFDTMLIVNETEKFTIGNLVDDEARYLSIRGPVQLLVNNNLVFTFNQKHISDIVMLQLVLMYIVDMPLQMKSAR